MKAINQALMRQVETKTKQTFTNLLSLYYPLNANYNANNTIPVDVGDFAIAQGVGDGQRVGNKIIMKKLTWNAFFTPHPQDVAINPDPKPNIVKLVAFYERSNPTAFPNPEPDFFQFGTGTSAIRGDNSDAIAPFNSDKYRILATKTFKLGYSSYTGAGSAGSTINQWYQNNDFKMSQCVKWDLTKYLPKKVIYNDASTIPTTRGLFVQAMISPADNTIGSGGVIPVTCQMWQEVKYKDA